MAMITDQVCELRVTGLPACAVLTTSRDPQWGPFGVSQLVSGLHSRHSALGWYASVQWALGGRPHTCRHMAW